MPETADRLFVSIAVSKPGGDLDELPGAIKAAERMAAWAAAQGYATVLVHDRKYPEVTIDLLRSEIVAALKKIDENDAGLKRLVVFFAGHGAALAVGDQYWILTNWKKRPTEAIKVSSLQRMLEYYGPRQVAVIGDACQEFSARFIDIVGSPVLDMPEPEEEQRGYELDQFFAVDAGKQAFMIKSTGEQDDFCLFTEVLLDALEGDAAQASYELIGTDRFVTSQSLALYLDGNVAQVAGKYGVRMTPRPKPGFYSDRIYLKMPPAASRPPPPPPPAIRPAPAPAISSHSPVGGWTDRSAMPRSAGATPGPAAAPIARSVEKISLAVPKAATQALAAQAGAILQARETRRQNFTDEVGGATVRDHFETGCGICISGAAVAKVEASRGAVSGVAGQSSWFRIRLDDEADSLGWSDTLVTLANGRVYAACVVQGFIAALHVLDDTSVSLFHRPIGAQDYEGQAAIDLLARAHAGLLSQHEIIDAAALLRGGKHRIITMGCIAAQFYDSIRDVDSLRSMASFYAQHHQPVPLDIVLYGGGRISQSEGCLYANIPAVHARAPRTPDEQQRGFTFDATPGFERHPVAGRIPWMRHAWGAILTANCEKSAEAWRRQALDAMAHLAPGSFTNVSPAGRDALVALAAVDANHLAPQPLHA